MLLRRRLPGRTADPVCRQPLPAHGGHHRETTNSRRYRDRARVRIGCVAPIRCNPSPALLGRHTTIVHRSHLLHEHLCCKVGYEVGKVSISQLQFGVKSLIQILGRRAIAFHSLLLPHRGVRQARPVPGRRQEMRRETWETPTFHASYFTHIGIA